MIMGYANDQSGNARLDKVKRKFTSFIKAAIVDFGDRESPTYPEGNIVEVSLVFPGSG
jgi:hypothetical protein